jgi:glycosyltransferase involved in cell wall biosynthesis
MKIVLSHPTGNENVRAAANGLTRAGLLKAFHVSIASFENSFTGKVSIGPFAEMKRRHFDTLLQPFTRTFPFLEAGRLIASKAGLRQLTRHETGMFCIDAVNRRADRYTASRLPGYRAKGFTAVYAYEDAAEYSFRAAKDLGMSTLYDLPIGYWRSMRSLLSFEKEARPEWASTLTGFKDSDSKLARKDEELRLADAVFVASSFTAKTLEEYPGKKPKIHLIPYGFPAVNITREYSPMTKRKLKLLFVGGLSQRKGIAQLFEAAAALQDHVELTVVGGKATEDNAALNRALARHRWIPSLPHHKILELMREQDVFVFPSLFEGFGLVITEAMSQGTPVITTERTIGPDVIEHGKNGWIVNAGSTLSLQNTIEELLQYPEKIIENGKNALITAASRPWEVYANELARQVAATLNLQPVGQP